MTGMARHAATLGIDLHDTVVWGSRIIGAAADGDLYLWQRRRWVRLQPVTPVLRRDLARLNQLRAEGHTLPRPRRFPMPSIVPAHEPEKQDA